MCGIFGVINKEVKPFNKCLFNVLGVDNDSRGKDSCGIYIDGRVEYGVGKYKLYKDFMLQSTLLKETTECKIAIGHCRKASVGKIEESTAQPITVSSEGKTKLVLIHNGTIYNYKELAKQYLGKRDIEGLTDSQVLALIINAAGFQVLSEYIGSAAFVALDYSEDSINPSVYIFKGASKLYSTYTQDVEERPLYLLTKQDGSLWFSSILQFLNTYVDEGDRVETIKPNTLYCYKGNKIEKYSYNRENCYQNKSYTSQRISYPYYSPSSYYNYYSSRDYWSEDVGAKEPFKDQEKWICPKSTELKGLVYQSDDCRFYSEGIPLHGNYRVSNYGYITSLNTTLDHFTDMWFYQGVLVYNKGCFMLLEKSADYLNMSNTTFMDSYYDIVYLYSIYPLIELGEDRNKVLLRSVYKNKDVRLEPFKGVVYPIFCNLEVANIGIKCNKGKIVEGTSIITPSNIGIIKGILTRYYKFKPLKFNILKQLF